MPIADEIGLVSEEQKIKVLEEVRKSEIEKQLHPERYRARVDLENA